MSRFFRKAFDIQLDDALQYPSSQIICETILKKEKYIEFINRENPVSFTQGNVVYQVEVGMARGGYVLYCKEIKE